MISNRLTKADIALSQLDLALSLYLRGTELISAITLAGAADEILGALCEKHGKQRSLARKVASARALHKHLWNQDPGDKAFFKLRNGARNEMKHFMSGAPLALDLEAQAGRLLAQAVENYRALYGTETAKMREFQRKRLRSARLHGA